MKAFADWIIFSCPSVNTYNDAVALSGMVDGVVLVSRQKKHGGRLPRAAKDRLLKSGCQHPGGCPQ